MPSHPPSSPTAPTMTLLETNGARSLSRSRTECALIVCAWIRCMCGDMILSCTVEAVVLRVFMCVCLKCECVCVTILSSWNQPLRFACWIRVPLCRFWISNDLPLLCSALLCSGSEMRDGRRGKASNSPPSHHEYVKISPVLLMLRLMLRLYQDLSQFWHVWYPHKSPNTNLPTSLSRSIQNSKRRFL